MTGGSTIPDIPEKPYQILEYNWDTLVGLFSRADAGSEKWDFVANKPQLYYLDEYFRRLKIQSIIYERAYTDKYYSDDYNGYYVRCFTRYEKTCSRIHLFSSEITEERIAKLFKVGAEYNLAKRGYRGFVVIKPLPQTVVGRTCLSTPENHAKPDGGHFLSGLENRPNLLGGDLVVRSLPCQEQDHEVAACATTAVWTLLQGTSELFANPILMPLEITQRGYEKTAPKWAAFPNDGLTMAQICDVVRGAGLEPLVTSAGSTKLMAAEANAYLRCGIPLILGWDFNLAPFDDPSPRELHAVVVSGIGEPTGSLQPLTVVGTNALNFNLRGTRIENAFVHDDGIGPYSSIDLSLDKRLIETRWRENGVRKQAIRLEMLAPLHRQIRLRFHDMLKGVAHFDGLMKETDRSLGLNIFSSYEWDIVLTTPRHFKREIAQSQLFSDEDRADLLAAGFPRFMWRVDAIEADKAKAILLFDATDLRQGAHVIRICYTDKESGGIFSAYVAGYRKLGLLRGPQITKSILRYLLQHPSDETEEDPA